MKIKPIIFASLIIFAGLVFISFRSSNKEPEEYLMVRTYESSSILYATSVIVVYENGVVEEKELATAKDRNAAANTKIINDVLNKVSKKGYTLHSVSHGGGDNYSSNTFIFIKN